MYRTFVLVLAVGAFGQNILCGEFDWPQWQGPDRNAHSKETGLLKEWPPTGPPLAWKTKGLGAGHATISVAGDKIFVHMLHQIGGSKLRWRAADAGRADQNGGNFTLIFRQWLFQQFFVASFEAGDVKDASRVFRCGSRSRLPDRAFG